MTTARGHRHEIIPYNDFTRPDGLRQVWARCICGLEERRTFRGPRPVDVEYRLGGVWMKPLDLIRRRDLPVEECPECHGEPRAGIGAPCVSCAGIGVVEDGHPVRLRAPAPISDPQPPVAA